MKITHTYSGPWGCSGGKCPSLHTTDDGRVIIQGIRLQPTEKAVMTVPDHEDAVTMDIATFRSLIAQLNS
jgi:hypothetical protein